MRKRNEPKPIQGWGWLGDAAEEAAVEATAPARPSNAIKAKQKPGNGRPPVAVKGGMQLSDDEYRRFANQHYQPEGKIEIDPHGRVSRSEDGGAWVQGWVFVRKPR